MRTVVRYLRVDLLALPGVIIMFGFFLSDLALPRWLTGPATVILMIYIIEKGRRELRQRDKNAG
jgi:hypothetical protein